MEKDNEKPTVRLTTIQESELEKVKEDEERVGNKPIDTLFNNPQAKAALASMSDEQKDHYKRLGECLFADNIFDQEDPRDYDDMPEFLKDAVAYIDEALKSGLHPRDLTKEDVKVLEETYGKQWYESWGYTKEDLKSEDEEKSN